MQRRWRDLAAAYYVQNMSHYPRDYILRVKNLPERVVETWAKAGGSVMTPGSHGALI